MDVAKGRWTRDDWTMAALRAIARGGINSVTVDGLATELGATRGSFYWHFKDRAALVTAAVEYWERRGTIEVIEDLARRADPRERLRALFAVAFDEEVIVGLEPALTAHADDPLVAPSLRRVTERRVAFLTSLYADLGLAPPVARRQAVTAYAAYLGWFSLRRIGSDGVPEVAPQGVAAADALPYLIDQLMPDERRHESSDESSGREP